MSENVSPFRMETVAESPARICVVTLIGKLDALAAADFEKGVRQLRGEGHSRFVFDLTRLDYVGSLGLRVFVSLHNELGAGEGLCLCGLSANVRSVIVVTRLDKIFHFYPTRAEAIDAALSW